jgi:hypothetical protein
MISRGWVERLPVKNPAHAPKFKITEAGQKLGAQSAHLFKWPAANSRIAPAFRYTARLHRGACQRYVIHLHAELARLGSQERISELQTEMLDDLAGGLDEEALAEMLHWWNYRLEALVTRGSHERPARPRIEVQVVINQKGNLTVRWQPVGLNFKNPTPECDWVAWWENEHRHIAFGSHPSNELLFVRNVRAAARPFPGFFNEDSDTPEDLMVDAILLQALAALVEELKRRLGYHFEVSMETDVFLELEQINSSQWPKSHDDVLATWYIENVASRRTRIERTEIERTHPFPRADSFVKIADALFDFGRGR